jgi:hypothetical protein
MTGIPIHPDRIDPIALTARKLMQDAEQAAAMHDSDLVEFARQTLMGRQQRNRYFDPVLFSNPAWDLLLNLYVAAAEERALGVLDCCAGSTVPQAVALRWLSFLKDKGMVVELPDTMHSRRTLVRLSDEAQSTMSSYLGSLICLGLGPEAFMPDALSMRN